MYTIFIRFVFESSFLMKRSCSILFFSLIYISSVQAQQRLTMDDFIIQHYTTANGLPSNYTYCAAQDEDGYLWIASDNGLSRFDGKNFQNYYAKDGLKDNMIISVWQKGKYIMTNSFRGSDFIYKSKILHTENFKKINVNQIVFQDIQDSIYTNIYTSYTSKPHTIQERYYIIQVAS